MKRKLLLLTMLLSVIGAMRTWADYTQSFVFSELSTNDDCTASITNAGWQCESSRWYYWNGIYDYKNSPSATTTLISPKITSEKNDQTITILGYNNGGSTSELRVYYSTSNDNNAEWTQIDDLSSWVNNTSSGTLASATRDFVVEGEYYIKLECLKVFLKEVRVEDKLPALTVSTTTLAFGNVYQSTEKTFTITNSGKAELTGLQVELTGDNVFSISELSKTTLAPKESMEVTVTLNPTEEGDFNANIKVKGNDVDAASIAVTGTYEVVDPVGIDIKFGSTFSLPDGWTYNTADGWTAFYYSAAATEYVAYPANYWEAVSGSTTWTSPLVGVSGESDKLFISAYKNGVYSDDVVFNVKYSTDKENWTTAKSFAGSDFQTSLTVNEVSGIPAGCYFFQIEVRDIAIDYIKGFGAEPFTIKSSTGWATCVTKNAVDFTGVEGLTAYTATVDGSVVTLAEAGKVPAGTALVLKGDVKTHLVPFTESAGTVDNALKGSATESKTITDTDYIYGLAVNGNNDVQFTRLSAGTLAAGKAYLELSAAAARSLHVEFADGTTGISTVRVNQASDNAVYNLNGQRISTPRKGLYIVGGKKIVMK